jgi:hypothetical protein
MMPENWVVLPIHAVTQRATPGDIQGEAWIPVTLGHTFKFEEASRMTINMTTGEMVGYPGTHLALYVRDLKINRLLIIYGLGCTYFANVATRAGGSPGYTMLKNLLDQMDGPVYKIIVVEGRYTAPHECIDDGMSSPVDQTFSDLLDILYRAPVQHKLEILRGYGDETDSETRLTLRTLFPQDLYMVYDEESYSPYLKMYPGKDLSSIEGFE